MSDGTESEELILELENPEDLSSVPEDVGTNSYNEDSDSAATGADETDSTDSDIDENEIIIIDDATDLSGEGSDEEDSASEPSDSENGEYGNDGSTDEDNLAAWPEEGLAGLLPAPDKHLETLFLHCVSDNQIFVSIDMTESEFEEYISICKEWGFSFEPYLQSSNKETGKVTEYLSFDSEGNKLTLTWKERESGSGSTNIALHAPFSLGTLHWPDYALGLVIPCPPTETGAAGGAPEIFLVCYLGDMPLDTYYEYIEDCKESGFTCSAVESDREYTASSPDGILLEASYYGNSIVNLKVTDYAQSWRSRGSGGNSEDGATDDPGLIETDPSPGTELVDSVGTEEMGPMSAEGTGDLSGSLSADNATVSDQPAADNSSGQDSGAQTSANNNDDDLSPTEPPASDKSDTQKETIHSETRSAGSNLLNTSIPGTGASTVSTSRSSVAGTLRNAGSTLSNDTRKPSGQTAEKAVNRSETVDKSNRKDVLTEKATTNNVGKGDMGNLSGTGQEHTGVQRTVSRVNIPEKNVEPAGFSGTAAKASAPRNRLAGILTGIFAAFTILAGFFVKRRSFLESQT